MLLLGCVGDIQFELPGVARLCPFVGWDPGSQRRPSLEPHSMYHLFLITIGSLTDALEQTKGPSCPTVGTHKGHGTGTWEFDQLRTWNPRLWELLLEGLKLQVMMHS